MQALGIDIGGSSLKGAPVDTLTGKLLAERHRIETPARLTPAQMADAVAAMAAHFQWRGRIGVGFPGVVQSTKILTAANLHPKFVRTDGVKLFGRATGLPVALANDAAAAGLAEMRFGAGRGYMGKTLLLTLGTGVGSCLAYQGVVTPIELGHLPWGGAESAEKLVAASVFEQQGLSWAEWGGRLRGYLAVLERALWPELILVGGGVSADHAKFFKYLKTRAPVKPARFRNEAGLVGAAIWAAEAKR